MSVRLHQSKIACPRCGEFIYRVFKIILNESREPELDPLCKNCNPKDFLEAALHAVKIETLEVQSRIVKGKRVNQRIVEK